MKQAATLFLPLLLLIPGLCLTSTITLPPGILTLPAENANAQPSAEAMPAESLYQILAAEMALDREHPEIALANYIAAAKETQDPKIAARATQIALAVASLEIAIEPALIWAACDAKNLEAQITVAALYIRLNQIANALPYLKRTESLNSDEAYQYFLILYRQLQKEDDSARVIAALQLLAEQEKTDISGHLALAEIYLYQGEEAKALAISKSALDIKPQAIIAIQLYSESLLRVRGKNDVNAFLAKKVTEEPKNALLGQYYAQFLIENNFHKEAHKIIVKLIANPKLSAEELFQLARLCMQAQWFDLAEKILHRTRQFPDSKDLSHYFLARLAELQNKDEEAIQWFKQVLTGPFHVLSQIKASILLAEKKQYEEALTILSRTQPNDNADKKQILLTTVQVQNKAKHYTQAFALLNSQIDDSPNDVDLYYARSLISDHLDRIDVAESDLKTIISIQPTHLDALNALGFLLADKTKRYDEAQAYLTRALKLSPNNASVLDSMGWLYYKMGNYKQSLEALQKAANIMPDAEIAAHLGEVMWKLQDFEGAKRIWKAALKNAPRHEKILNTIQRLNGKNTL